MRFLLKGKQNSEKIEYLEMKKTVDVQIDVLIEGWIQRRCVFNINEVIR